MKEVFQLFYETCIAPLVAAVDRLAASQGSPPVALGTPAVVTPAEPAAAPAKRTRKAVDPAPAPAAAPAEDLGTPAAAEPEGEAVLGGKPRMYDGSPLTGEAASDLELIRFAVQDACAAGRKPEVKGFLEKVGVEKVTQVPIEKYKAFMKAVAALIPPPEKAAAPAAAEDEDL